jgi:hypothetical protein
MKTIFAGLIIALLTVGCTSSHVNTYSSGGESKETIRAQERGIANAKKDITKGKMKILYYGKPWSQGKPFVDDKSGLPIEVVAGCCVSPGFIEEVNAYNAIMRQEAKRRKRANTRFTPTKLDLD